MNTFEDFLETLSDAQKRQKLRGVLGWVTETFDELEHRIAWNQPMFTHHGTYIIGFSASTQHIAVAPERTAMVRFSKQIEASGYSQAKQIFRIRWSDEIDYGLLERIIRFNIEDKAECSTFWRKES